MEVDETDRTLLAALRADPRASDEELSAETGVPVPVVEQRRADYRDREVVRGVEPRIDYGALGYEVTAVMRIRESEAADDVAARLAEKPRFVTVYAVTGADDVLAIGKFEALSGMSERVEGLRSAADVAGVTTSVVLEAPAEGRGVELADGD
jgi:DNA-binding Lrp family transcriptional regulator